MSSLPTPSLSATVDGAVSNRVKKLRAPRAAKKPNPPRKVKAKRPQPTHDVTQVCYSMPVSRADEIATWAERAGMNCSAFVREAAFRYAASLGLVTQ